MADLPEFLDVQVVLRSGCTGERRWRVEADTSVPVRGLLPDLVRGLRLGRVSDYEIGQEGTLVEPVLVLRRKNCPRQCPVSRTGTPERSTLVQSIAQWGGATPKAGGRELDGRTWEQVPAAGAGKVAGP